MKKMYILLFVLLTSVSVQAQFPTNAGQTFYVCDARHTENTVSAFADGKGGTYSFWIDTRDSTAQTSIYGQHLDSLGFPLWPVNGKFFAGANAKDIWSMTAIPWQSGILIAWVQGSFGIGGDTLLCNYYDTSGTAQWAQPTVAANKQGNVTDVTYNNFNLYPNTTGATIAFGLQELGGNDYFSFNHINFAGKLTWPLDTFNYQSIGYYYQTGDDHHGGFYVATSTGGLGTAIYVGHFDSTGVLTITTPVNITTVAGGRGEGQWNVLADTHGNGYVVWDDGTDVYIAKVEPDGTQPWSGTKTICNAAGERTETYAIMYNDTIYVLWDDARPGAAVEYDIYMQKLDTAGNTYWTPNGIQLSNLSAYEPYPKLVKTGSNVVVGLELNVSFNGQQIRPDSTIVWPENGVEINSTYGNLPFYGDYVLVAVGGGNVVAVWNDDAHIAAARVRPNGTLTQVTYLNKNSMALYPNPVTDNFTIRLAQPVTAPVTISIYNSLGEVMQQQQFAPDVNDLYMLNTDNLSSGLYFVKVSGENYFASSKICVVKE